LMPQGHLGLCCIISVPLCMLSAYSRYLLLFPVLSPATSNSVFSFSCSPSTPYQMPEFDGSRAQNLNAVVRSLLHVTGDLEGRLAALMVLSYLCKHLMMLTSKMPLLMVGSLSTLSAWCWCSQLKVSLIQNSHFAH